jgi:hypothetical protein
MGSVYSDERMTLFVMVEKDYTGVNNIITIEDRQGNCHNDLMRSGDTIGTFESEEMAAEYAELLVKRLRRLGHEVTFLADD